MVLEAVSFATVDPSLIRGSIPPDHGFVVGRALTENVRGISSAPGWGRAFPNLLDPAPRM